VFPVEFDRACRRIEQERTDPPPNVQFGIADRKRLASANQREALGIDPCLLANLRLDRGAGRIGRLTGMVCDVARDTAPVSRVRADRIAAFQQENLAAVLQKSRDDGAFVHYFSRSTTNSANSRRNCLASLSATSAASSESSALLDWSRAR